MSKIQNLDEIAKKYYFTAYSNLSVSQQNNVIAIQANQIKIAKIDFKSNK